MGSRVQEMGPGKTGPKKRWEGSARSLNSASSLCSASGAALCIYTVRQAVPMTSERRFNRGSRFSEAMGPADRAAKSPRRAWDCRNPKYHCHRHRCCFLGHWASRRYHPRCVSRSPGSGW